MNSGKRRGILLDDNDPTLFPKLTDEQMDLLARNGQVRPTRSGEVLFREGDATNDVMVVLEGSVVVTVGKGDSERELAIQCPRDLIAELNVPTGQKVGATGIVREAGWVLA
jgi:thioredoxin reductase (NADPH)